MQDFNWKAYLINFTNVILSSISLGVLKFHDLTSFHVFIVFLFSIMSLYVIVDKIEKNKKIHKSNVFYSVLVLFYIVYSIIAKQVQIKNPVFTNLISANLLLIAIGCSIRRRYIPEKFQERLVLFAFITLCFPINILQTTSVVALFVRKLLFLILFNIELYIGKILDYHTNYKQLFLISYFVFVVDMWYLIGVGIIVLSHFLEISKKIYSKTTDDRNNEFGLEEADIEEGTEINTHAAFKSDFETKFLLGEKNNKQTITEKLKEISKQKSKYKTKTKTKTKLKLNLEI
jgi:hypothetical protein